MNVKVTHKYRNTLIDAFSRQKPENADILTRSLKDSGDYSSFVNHENNLADTISADEPCAAGAGYYHIRKGY